MKKVFQLDKRGGKLMGVCAGIADYTGLDVTLVRIGMVLVTLLGAFPWTLVAYGVTAWLAKPKSAWSHQHETPARIGGSTYDLKTSMRDIDRRMAEVDTYVTSHNMRLAREIEELR